MKHKILIAMSLFVFASSCMKVKKKGEDDESASPTTQAQSKTVKSADRTKLTYTYLDSSSEFPQRVQFLAPTTWHSEIIVSKTVKAGTTQMDIQFVDGLWTDFLTSDEKVNYKFMDKRYPTVILDEVSVLPVLIIDATEDIDLVTKYNLDSKTKLIYIKQMDIASQAHVYIEDFSGKIEIEELHSNSGFLQTFPMDHRAKDGSPGKNGGTVEMKINSGTGLLNFVMAGENGGNGAPARAPDEKLKGVQGNPGKPAQFDFVSVVNSNGGLSGYVCNTPPEDGGDGFEGHQGYPGNDGLNGGNTGSAMIENYGLELKVKLISVVGSKGNGSGGGEGGVGGDPSLGGDGSNKDLARFIAQTNLGGFGGVLTPCAPSKSGKSGGAGKLGEKGNPGLDGLAQTSCLISADLTKKCINE